MGQELGVPVQKIPLAETGNNIILQSEFERKCQSTWLHDYLSYFMCVCITNLFEAGVIKR